MKNTRSVVCALEDAACQSYWTRTGKMDEVLFFLKYNIGEVRDDVVKMIHLRQRSPRSGPGSIARS